MENAAQPTAPPHRSRCRRAILAKNGCGQKRNQKKQNDAAFHEWGSSAESFLGCKIPVKPFINRHANSQCIRTLPRFRAGRWRSETTALHVPSTCTSELAGHRGVRDICSRPDIGQKRGFEKMPWISEQDVTAFSAYPAQDGTYGALIQLDEHGRVVLDTLSVERRGGFLFVFVNGRLITELQIDKRVSDGKIFIPSGLTGADIDLMKKDWRQIGQQKRQSH